jgi:hypothetical protein
MQLTQEDIDEFKALYRKHYGQDISDTEARDMGMRLLRVLKVILDVCGQPARKE